MFASRVNCITGKMEWVVTEKNMESVDTDLSEEFSRSQYGDMLRDTERNKKYELGLKWAVSNLLSRGMEPKILDIGSGTGLLSMMAARNGAKKVTAIEVLKPMIRILKDAIQENGHQNAITVIPKHSTEVRVGPGGDMPQRANILVTEVFDSELIGEGAVPTFRHAHKELLEEGALVIPSEGKVYAQLIQSEFLWHSHSLDPAQLPTGVSVNIPRPWHGCLGPASLWDIHLEEVIGSYDVTPLSEPHLVATFSFSDPSLPVYKEHSPVPIPTTKSGSCNAIAIWWTITLAPGVELSMSPWQPNMQWRDHWLACVQVLPQPLALKEGSSIKVQAINDEYTMWAVILDNSRRDIGAAADRRRRPVCSCGVHLAWSRSRLRMMNSRYRNNRFMAALDEILPNVSSVLCVSDGSLLPIFCSQRGHHDLEKIYSVESNTHSMRSLNELIKDTSLPIPVQVLDKSPTELVPSDVGNSLVDALIAEPFFITSTLPWHNLYYWYVRSSLAGNILAPGAVVMPCVAVLKVIAVRFQDLHLLKAAVGTVEGFDISAYDRAVANTHQRPQGEALDPEDYALWEYPCYSLSRVQTLMKFDFTDPVPVQEKLETQGSFPLTANSTLCHGVVMWMEYQLTPQDKELLSEGLIEPPSEGSKLIWSSGHNQAVCFFMDYEKTEIKYTVAFETSTGEMNFKFYS